MYLPADRYLVGLASVVWRVLELREGRLGGHCLSYANWLLHELGVVIPVVADDELLLVADEG